MTPTTYQKPEIRDANDNIIQQGAFGKNTALANSTNDGWIDYVANDLEFLYGLAKDEVVPVPSLPASGQTNKTYLLTTTGVSYRWSGTQWVAVSSSEAVGRAESAASLAEQWATKTDGTVDGTEYSAKYYAEQAEQSADDAQDTADDMETHLVQIDKNTGGVAKNSKRISNIEKLLQGNLYDYDTDDDTAYVKTVPSGALPYAGVEKIGGKTLVMNQLVKDGNFALGDTTYWKKQGTTSTTLEFANGVATVTLGGNPSVFNPAITQQTDAYIQAVQGHKYLIKAETMADFTITGLYFSSSATGGSFTIECPETKDSWISLSKIITATTDGRLFGYIGAQGRADIVQGSKLNFRNIFMVDLTLMFGSGNEPSTVAEFQQQFSADYYPYNAGTLLSAGVTSIVSKDSNDDALQTLPIPAEVRALEGYGWSAGSVSNYIDFERKVFVKNVATVDCGTLSWALTGSGNFRAALPSGTKSVEGDMQAVLLGRYIFGGRTTGNGLYWNNSSTSNTYLFIRDESISTAEAFTTSMSGVYANYVLSNPIETDISAYLTDNLIEVGAGGTLTFPNSNGDDYHIPVPSTETYMIDLQEAISNG